jgi:cob(I)alamin adenosyltransferase
MKIYTKTGDSGLTGLFAGPRVRKDDVRIEAYGAVDELNAFIGLARTQALPAEIESCLARVQNELFAVGAELATPDPVKHGTALIGPAHAEALEQAIDALEANLPPLRQFVLPGGASSAAHLHVARGICRRAERRVITLAGEDAASFQNVLIYLNRLGDYLFVAARWANHSAGATEIPWNKPG